MFTDEYVKKFAQAAKDRPWLDISRIGSALFSVVSLTENDETLRRVMRTYMVECTNFSSPESLEATVEYLLARIKALSAKDGEPASVRIILVDDTQDPPPSSKMN